MDVLTALALAAIVLGLVGLLVLASAAPLPLTLAVVLMFLTLYATKDHRR